MAAGPFSSFSIKKLSHRKTTLLGSFLATIGLSMQGLFYWLDVKNILVFYFTGGLTGLGFGTMYLPAMTVIDLWFSTSLGLASGIAAAGSGVGQFLFSPLFQW